MNQAASNLADGKALEDTIQNETCMAGKKEQGSYTEQKSGCSSRLLSFRGWQGFIYWADRLTCDDQAIPDGLV